MYRLKCFSTQKSSDFTTYGEDSLFAGMCNQPFKLWTIWKTSAKEDTVKYEIVRCIRGVIAETEYAAHVRLKKMHHVRKKKAIIKESIDTFVRSKMLE